MACLCRRPTHAGSWYSARRDELAGQLDLWLAEATPTCGAARALIAPHAGYAYSGPTAAWAYRHVVPDGVRRVLLLGPSHSAYLAGCAVSGCDAYATPAGDITVDEAARAALLATGQFETMDLAVDEREHSLELHLPYIAHVMGRRPCAAAVPRIAPAARSLGAIFRRRVPLRRRRYTLVPVMVGALNEEAEARCAAARQIRRRAKSSARRVGSSGRFTHAPLPVSQVRRAARAVPHRRVDPRRRLLRLCTGAAASFTSGPEPRTHLAGAPRRPTLPPPPPAAAAAASPPPLRPPTLSTPVQSIGALDRQAMALIEKQDAPASRLHAGAQHHLRRRAHRRAAACSPPQRRRRRRLAAAAAAARRRRRRHSASSPVRARASAPRRRPPRLAAPRRHPRRRRAVPPSRSLIPARPSASALRGYARSSQCASRDDSSVSASAVVWSAGGARLPS